MSQRRVSPFGTSLTIAALLLTLAFAMVEVPAGAQDAPTPNPIEIGDVDSPLGDIIPRPNSGVAPTDPGDRGGSLQLTLLALIIAFFAIAVFSIRRSMLKARGA